jgi:hypothetical protein
VWQLVWQLVGQLVAGTLLPTHTRLDWLMGRERLGQAEATACGQGG